MRGFTLFVGLAVLVELIYKISDHGFHLHRYRFHSAAKRKKGDQRENGNGQTDDGGTESLTDAGSDSFEIAGRHYSGSDVSENVYQSAHRAQKTKQRSNTHDDLKNEQPALQPQHFTAGTRLHVANRPDPTRPIGEDKHLPHPCPARTIAPQHHTGEVPALTRCLWC